MNKKYIKILLTIFLAIFLYFGIIYFCQSLFLFKPETKYKNPVMANSAEFKENPIIVSNGSQIMTWFFEGNKDKPMLLYFHGNTGQISKFSPALKPLTDNGYTIAVMEYRGFGNTKGKLRQDTTFKDAVDFYDYYTKKFPNKEVVFYGYSFGCAVSLGLTQYRTPNAIILTAPFYSFTQEVKDHYVPFAHLLLRDKYPSYQYIQNIDLPLLIIHGNKDKLIKPYHSQKLYTLATSKNKKLVFVDDTNHHDIYFTNQDTPIILNWLENLDLK